MHCVLHCAHVWLFLFRCVDMVKSSQYVELANDLEINKAITYLRQKDFNQVNVCLNNIKGNTTQLRLVAALAMLVATVTAKQGQLKALHHTVTTLFRAVSGLP